MRFNLKRFYCSCLCIAVIIVFCECSNYVDKALDYAGDNRHELETVLDHYKDNPEKLAAAYRYAQVKAGAFRPGPILS